MGSSLPVLSELTSLNSSDMHIAASQPRSFPWKNVNWIAIVTAIRKVE